MGAKKRPFYRLVVADARSPRDGRFIELIGTYDPLANPAIIKIDGDRVKEWMSKGARPTDMARQLLVTQGLLEHTGPRFEAAPKKPQLSKKAQAKAAAPPAEPVAAAAEAPEAPVEATETPTEATAETPGATEAAPAAVEAAPAETAAAPAETAAAPAETAAAPAETAEAPAAAADAPVEDANDA
jgi:small subunit ribosomal protein S16